MGNSPVRLALFGLLMVALPFIPNGRSPSGWDNLPLRLTPPRREATVVLDILLATRGRSGARRNLEPLLIIDWLEAGSVTSARGGRGALEAHGAAACSSPASAEWRTGTGLSLINRSLIMGFYFW